MWILIVIFNFLIGAWFYSSAKEVGKSKFLWFCLGLITSIVLGSLFIKFGEIYILPKQDNIAEVFRNRNSKIYLQIVTMGLVSGYAYMVQNLFLRKK
ncbi:MAG: hypothetical protein WC061_00975 [Melioribacteraceae bacterium]